MTELYPDIPEEIRERVKLVADFALNYTSLPDGIKMLAQYVNTCINEEEKEFADFYFRMRIEQGE